MSEYCKAEVGEDCISREQVRAELDYISYAEKDPISIAKRIVENASSVIPQVPNEDAISREWLISFIDAGHLRNPNELCYSENGVVELIKHAPSVVPSRAEGEWIRTFDGNEWYWYCSNCKEQWYEDDLYMGGNEFPHFCPDCGAKMKGADDD